MSKKLTGRCKLLLRTPSGSWTFSESFLTYSAAVRAGQQRAECGFTIDTIRVPTREEQLLQTTTVSKQKAVLDFL